MCAKVFHPCYVTVRRSRGLSQAFPVGASIAPGPPPRCRSWFRRPYVLCRPRCNWDRFGEPSAPAQRDEKSKSWTNCRQRELEISALGVSGELPLVPWLRPPTAAGGDYHSGARVLTRADFEPKHPFDDRAAGTPDRLSFRTQGRGIFHPPSTTWSKSAALNSVVPPWTEE